TTFPLSPARAPPLLHSVVPAKMVTPTSSAAVRAAVETTATSLAAAPEIDGLSLAEVCSIDNFDAAALTANGFDFGDCTPTNKNRKALVVEQAPVPNAPKAMTKAKYDVVGKTIGQLRADIEAGVTTSREITQAYLDRIEFYDRGQFGFNAFAY